VQYERNILGNKPQHHGGFHFKRDMPLPPRSNGAPRVSPTFQISHSPNRTASFPLSPARCEAHRASNRKLEKRASELSDGDDSYVFIPDMVHDPSRVPLPSPSVDFNSPAKPTSGGPHFHDPIPEWTKFPDPAFEGSHFADPFHPGSSFAENFADPTSNFSDPSFQGANFGDPGSHFADPSYSGSSPSHLPVGSLTPFQPPPPLPSEEVSDSTQLNFSDDYEDVVGVSQQLRLVLGNGAVPHVVATQEIRSANSSVPIPPHSDYTPALRPSTHRPTSPNKPAIKPRRKKILSESDSPSPAPSSNKVQKSLTIPKSHALYSEYSEHVPSTRHHTLDLSAQDGRLSSSPPTVDTVPHLHTAPEHLPPATKTQWAGLLHPPLTPPIPRPRPGIGRFSSSAKCATDDSAVGRNTAGFSWDHCQYSHVSDV
jgi:hypothetical protein